MSENSEQSTNTDKVIAFIERWGKVAGLVASAAAALAFATNNVWLSYAFIIIGWVFISRWLWRVVSAKTRVPAQDLLIPASTRLPERFVYAKTQRLLAAIGLVSLTCFVFFWLWSNRPISFQRSHRQVTSTPPAILFEETLNDLLLARKAEATVLRLLPSQICTASQHIGQDPIVYDCTSKQPLGYLYSSVAPTEWTPSYLLNPNGERVGFINEIFLYDLSGHPVALVDRGNNPRPNLSGYFDDDTLSELLKLPKTTLPLLERYGFHFDTLPNATIFSDEVERGLHITYIVEGQFTWGDVRQLEP